MAYFKLKGRVEITKKDGKRIAFDAFNNIEAERDIFKINSSCYIRIPLSARLKYDGAQAGESVQTAKQFERGDKVSVWLGYAPPSGEVEGALKLEYEGFISRINFKTPLEIECEGYEHLLRTPVETKTWGKTTMKEVLQYIIKGTEITLSDDVPDVPFTKFIIPAESTRLNALQMVKEQYGMTIYFTGAELYAGLAYTVDRGTVKYKLGWNTIQSDNLKYRHEDDVSLKIKAVWIKPDNTKIEAEVGDPNGSVRTLFFYNVESKEALKQMAAEEIKKHKYSGYEGKITTFLQPFAIPGMKAELTDPKYEEREGTYYISKTKVTAGTSGGRREVEITVKLN
jgi:hypothetical protein